MEPRWRQVLLLLCALAALLPGALRAQELSLKAAFEPAEAAPGGEVMLVLRAEVTHGWHAYGTLEETNPPVSLDVSAMQLGGLEPVGSAIIPPGVPTKGPFDMVQYPLPESFAVKLKLKVPAAATGEVVVGGELGYQICNESTCLPPDRKAFEAKLKVVAGAAQEPAGAAGAGAELKPGLKLDPDAHVTVTARFEPAEVHAGEAASLVLHATVMPGWHAYGAKEEVNVPVAFRHADQEVDGLQFDGEAKVPDGEPKERAFGMVQYELPHEFEVVQRVLVPTDRAPGVVQVSGVLDYQVCDEKPSCLPPAKAPYLARLTILSGKGEPGAAPTATQRATPPAAVADQEDPLLASWWALILAGIGGGLFALAMPCTYPMIPITFSFFTKQAEKRGGNVLPLTIVYGLGIVAMFVATGVLLSEVIQDVVNHWVTNTIIGVAFFFFAAVLFGWVNLNPPQWMQRMAFKAQTSAQGSKAGTSGALLGVFFMGATLVITSFTCTAPIVGTLIANVSKLGTDRVAVGMGAFGVTMALPFMLLALTPGRVKAMPKAGQWMDTLKISLGFVELAAAFKFVSMVDFAMGWQALPRELFLMLWAAIFALWALFLFGILRKAGTANEGVGNGRMASGMVVSLLAAYFLFGALGNRLDPLMTSFIPGYSNSLVASSAGGKKHAQTAHLLVKDDPDAALALAKKEDKLLLYNFTGFN